MGLWSMRLCGHVLMRDVAFVPLTVVPLNYFFLGGLCFLFFLSWGAAFGLILVMRLRYTWDMNIFFCI